MAGKTKIGKEDALLRKDTIRQMMKLRRAGWHYQDIADKFGMSKSGVHTIIQRELDEAISEDAKHIVKLDLERLDVMYLECQAKLEQGDTSVVQHMLRILERRSKYLGLDKQQAAEVDVNVSIIDLVKKAVEDSEPEEDG